jgi:hypothetical protein
MGGFHFLVRLGEPGDADHPVDRSGLRTEP